MVGKVQDLIVKGDPNAVDSFAACVCAVAEDLGLSVEYEFVEALTGTCFSPCCNQGEECIGWMMDGGNAYRVEFMAQSLGLAVEKITLEPGSPDDWFEAYQNGVGLPEQVATYFSRLGQLQSAEQRIVLATWPAWSVLTGWAEDLAQLPFVTTPGFEQVVAAIWPPIRSRMAFAFNRVDPYQPKAEMIKAALRFGSQIASGELSPQVPGYDAGLSYGGAMYDLIISRAGQEFLCPGCQEDGCFDRTAKRLHDGHHASLVFLEEASKVLGGESQALHFKRLQASYAAMQAISSQYLDWHQRRDNWAAPTVRRQIQADFIQMKSLHQQAAEQFAQLLEIL